MDEAVIQKGYEAIKAGLSCTFATIVESTRKGTPRKRGAKMVVMSDGQIFGTIGGGRNEKAVIEACQKALKTGQSSIETYDYFGHQGQSICGGQIKVFIEPFLGKKKLIICGAGHIALALSFLGKLLDFDVMVIDDRKEFANTKRFPHVDKIIVGNHAATLAKITITDRTSIMIVTQGNEFDFECLKTVVCSSAQYIGVISSRAKRMKFFRRLKDFGVGAKHLKQIQIPSGVDIGAQTPAEVAISIAAEIIAKNNRAHLGTVKFSDKTREV